MQLISLKNSCMWWENTLVGSCYSFRRNLLFEKRFLLWVTTKFPWIQLHAPKHFLQLEIDHSMKAPNMDINVALNFNLKKKTEIETKQRDAFLSQQLLLIWSFLLISAQAPRFFFLRRIAWRTVLQLSIYCTVANCPIPFWMILVERHECKRVHLT